jgi:hypothetical protein
LILSQAGARRLPAALALSLLFGLHCSNPLAGAAEIRNVV